MAQIEAYIGDKISMSPLDAIDQSESAQSEGTVEPAAIAYSSLLQDIATINATVSRCSDRAELWQLLTIAQDIEALATKLVDAVFDRIGRILAAADEDTTESPF